MKPLYKKGYGTKVYGEGKEYGVYKSFSVATGKTTYTIVTPHEIKIMYFDRKKAIRDYKKIMRELGVKL